MARRKAQDGPQQTASATGGRAVAVELDERFWSKTEVVPCRHPKIDTPCYEWRGCTQSRGRGQFWYAGKVELPYRLVAAAVAGKDLADIAGQLVLHKCDNLKCCAPDHVQLGTHEQNMADMAAAGRSRNQHTKHRPQEW